MYLNLNNKLSYIDDKRIIGKFDYSKKEEEKQDWWKTKDELRTKYDFLNARLILDAVKDDLIKLGGHKLKAYFSGGHDEGGFDDVELLDENDKVIPIPEFSKKVFLWKIIQHTENEIEYFIEKQETERLKFPEQLDQIFDNARCLEEWGSFAGEFNVNGHFLMDIKSGKWDMQGTESYESYEDISKEGQI